MSETKIYDCAVIGGGFTGLAAAADLAKKGRSVIVLEKEAELGGLAAGFDVGGYELERFYHHWFTSDRHISDLAAQVGVADQIVFRASSTGMYYAGKSFRLSTPFDLLKFDAIPLFDRIRTGFATLAVRRVKDWQRLEALTAKEWLIRLFGKKAYKVIWEPLLIGKFGRYAEQISAVWFWNKLTLRGGSRGSGGAEELAYFKGGFARLAREVGAYVERQGGRVATGAGVAGIAPGDDTIRLDTEIGPVRARSVLVTTPLPLAADLMANHVAPSYADSLKAIEYLGNVCLVLELDRSLSELYWININDPDFPFVGVIEHTNFEPIDSYGGRHIVYLSKYLPTDDRLFGMSADEMLDFATPHIQRMFPDFQTDWVKRHHLWKADHAQPIVVRHYSRLIPDFETPMANVFLAAMAQVYPEDRGTNYAVREGKKAAAEIHRRLSGQGG